MRKATTFEMKKILEVKRMEEQLFKMIEELSEEKNYNKRVTMNLKIDVLQSMYSQVCAI